MSEYLSLNFLNYAIALTGDLMVFVMATISVSYIFLLFASLFVIRNHHKIKETDYPEDSVSIIVPCFNQENTILDTIKSFLKQNYNNKEVILVNDGSSDESFNLIKKAYNFIEIDSSNLKKKNEKVISIYECSEFRLKLINKLNGGKSDAINCGIEISSSDYFCVVDGDSILSNDALKKTMFYFWKYPKTIAVGSRIRDANGLEIIDSEVKTYVMPKLWIEKFQHVEYLKSFLIARAGLEFFKSNLIISGAFGVFRKDIVQKIGGFTLNHFGEDMDLIVRLHKNKKIDQEIRFNPEALCFTQVPYDKDSLSRQRIRWQRGLIESLFSDENILIFRTTKNVITFLSVPYFILTEIIAPLTFFLYHVLLLLSFIFSIVLFKKLLFLGMISVLYNLLLTMVVVYFNEKYYSTKMNEKFFFHLMLVSLLESFGYRQLISHFKLVGMLRIILHKKDTWGFIQRKKF